MLKVLKSIQVVLGILIIFGSTNSFAEGSEKEAEHGNHQEKHHGGHHSGPINTAEAIQEYKEHHLKDAHDFVLFVNGETNSHVGFHLPVILVDEGLQVFSSAKFNWEQSVAEVNGKFYAVHHGQIYRTDASGEKLMYKPLDLSITKNVLGMLLTGVLLFFMFRSLAKGYKKGPVPTGIGRVLEPLVLYVRDDIARPNIGDAKYRKFMGYLLTVFFFIWLVNLLGMTPLAFNVTGNIAVTCCLALFTFFIVNVSGNKDYWGHIFWMPGVPVPMKIVLAPIEVLGMFTKPFSLMIRLFANMTAGHFVVMSLIALTILLKQQFTVVGSTSISLVLAIFISVIELLVAFLQAYIFTMLTSLFIGMAVQEHHHDDHH